MEMKLDGNAAGGMLQVTLPFDMTLVQATCAGCGATNALGAIVAYMHGMGTVVRCQSCDLPVLRHGAHAHCAGQGTLPHGYAGHTRPRDRCRVLVGLPGPCLALR